MKKNVCGKERVFRAVIGIVIMLAGLYYGSWWGIVGVLPWLTSMVGYCPLNEALHVSSCPIRATT